MKGARSWHFVQRRWWKIYSDISTKAEQIAQSFPSYNNHKSSDAVNTGTFRRLVFLCTRHFLGHFTPCKCSCNMFEMGKCNKLESKRWEKLAIIQFPQLSLLSNYSIKIFSSCQNCSQNYSPLPEAGHKLWVFQKAAPFQLFFSDTEFPFLFFAALVAMVCTTALLV